MTLLMSLLLAFGLFGMAQAAKPTQLTWYGQSAFKLVTPAGHLAFIDPWILNPVNKLPPPLLDFGVGSRTTEKEKPPAGPVSAEGLAETLKT